ncbi:integral membrane protein [Nannizzia gypsea CBS 118893]|uniref:Integral membrane protein n=1 Tax=Arthroderma gypseum (strain ATCC MYA-4604 / CBS 118893) TaxID=535722 RepID=E4UV49_ARTGP|nr:integral membrane protein [Nannizzia gypsea CBS 118893]EFR01166.1 integral membrane protein [Nannizzia gypsea CBS 118893]
MASSWDINQESSSDDKGPMVICVAWLFFVIAALVLGVRVWLRTSLTKLFGWDDAFMILALAFGCVHSALVNVSVDYGLGIHQANLTESQVILLTRYFWVSGPIHDLAVNWGKVSAMLLLIRVVDRAKRHAVYFYIGIVLLTLVNTTDVFIILGQCRPMEAAWNPSIRGRCWAKSVVKTSAYFQSACCCLSDLILAGYPVIVISRLRMPLRTKITLSVIMSLSLIAFVAPVMKAYYIHRMGKGSDYSWKMADLAMWGSLKHYLVIITASIPALGPLCKHITRLASSRGFRWFSYPKYTQSSSYHPKPKSLATVTVSSGPSTKVFSEGYSMSTMTGDDSYPMSKYNNSGRKKEKYKQKQQSETASSQEAIVPVPEQNADEITKVTEVCIRTESKENIAEYWEQRIKPWEAKSPV